MIKQPDSEYPVFAYYEESASAGGLPFHFHHGHELIFVADGQAEFSFGYGSCRPGPGSLIAIGNLERHRVFVTGTPYRRYVLSVSADYLIRSIHAPELTSLFLYRSPDPHRVLVPDRGLIPKITHLFGELIAESSERSDFWELRCRGLLTELLIVLYRKHPEFFPGGNSTAQEALILDVQGYLLEHFRENITLGGTAKAHYVSSSHLSRIFFRTTGYHFKEYLLLLRLNEARRLLLTTRLPVADVGYACGYRDVNHFIRSFQEHEGMTPGRYRKNPF